MERLESIVKLIRLLKIRCHCLEIEVEERSYKALKKEVQYSLDHPDKSAPMTQWVSYADDGNWFKIKVLGVDVKVTNHGK